MRNRQTTPSTSSCDCIILMVRRKENSNLCFSNNDRDTVSYRRYVKNSFNIPICFSTSVHCSLSVIALTKRSINQLREYWYMGSMMRRSLMQKKRVAALKATGRRLSRETLISFSVIAA